MLRLDQAVFSEYLLGLIKANERVIAGKVLSRSAVVREDTEENQEESGD